MAGNADIFISYSQADRDWVKELAAAFETEGFSVWWDPNLLPGTKYRDAIKKELEGAKAVVVVWSRLSIESDWVRDEAEEARQYRKLVPVLKDPISPPHGFRQLQTANLSQWRGRREHPEFRSLVEGIRALAAATAPEAVAGFDIAMRPKTSPPAAFQKHYGYAAVVLAILLGTGVYLSHLLTHQTQTTVARGPDATELALWNSVGTSGDPMQLNEYLARYPNGAFASVAHSKLAALTQPVAQADKNLAPSNVVPATTATVHSRAASSAADGVDVPQRALIKSSRTGKQPTGSDQQPSSATGSSSAMNVGWWRASGGSGDAHFGGPPFAYYHTTLTNVAFSIEFSDTNQIINAGAQAMMTETSSDDRLPPIAPNQHNFTMVSAQNTGGEIEVQLAGAPGNQPRTKASFHGHMESGAIRGTLVVDRNEVGAVTPQVLWTISIPLTLAR